MRIRDFLGFFLVALPICDAAAAPIKSDQASLLGAWSEPVDAIRARLAYVETDRTEAQSRQGIVYVDLQNTSGFEPKYLHYAPGQPGVRCLLRTARGEPVAQAASVYSGPMPSATWLTIPGDGILRVRVTLPGYGIPDQAGIFVAGQRTDCWFIPAKSTDEYFLSASMTIVNPRASAENSDPPEQSSSTLPSGSKGWEGKLELPAIRIASRAAAAPYEIVIESEPVVIPEVSQHAFRILVRDLGVQRMIAPELYWGLCVVLDGAEYRLDPKRIGTWNGPHEILPRTSWRTGFSLGEYLVPPEKLAPGRHILRLKDSLVESNSITFFVEPKADPKR